MRADARSGVFLVASRNGIIPVSSAPQQHESLWRAACVNSTLSIRLYMSMLVSDPSLIVLNFVRDIATMIMVAINVTQCLVM